MNRTSSGSANDVVECRSSSSSSRSGTTADILPKRKAGLGPVGTVAAEARAEAEWWLELWCEAEPYSRISAPPYASASGRERAPESPADKRAVGLSLGWGLGVSRAEVAGRKRASRSADKREAMLASVSKGWLWREPAGLGTAAARAGAEWWLEERWLEERREGVGSAYGPWEDLVDRWSSRTVSSVPGPIDEVVRRWWAEGVVHRGPTGEITGRPGAAR